MKALQCLLTVIISTALLETVSAEEMSTQYLPYEQWLYEKPLPSDSTFWQCFQEEFQHRAPEIFFDRFHPANSFDWRFESDSDVLKKRVDERALGSFSASLSYSLREAVLDLEFFSRFEERYKVLAEFLVNSIGEIEEEELDPLNPSYGLLGHSWWRKIARSKGARFGLRPFSSSPYAFLSFNVRQDKEPLALVNLRYRYGYSGNLEEHRIETAFSIPINGYFIDIGTAFRVEPRPRQERQSLLVKLYKQIGKNGLVYTSLSIDGQLDLLVGISKEL